jgi:prefoldin subunit 5
MSYETERLAVIETEIQSIKVDIHSLYKKTEEINSLNTAIALLTASVNELKTTVSTLNIKLDNVSNEPNKEKANKWNTIVTAGIGAIVGGLISFVFMKLGLSK